MKLYYSPGACSLSPHIVASRAGIDLQLEKVDTKTHTAGGADYFAINPKGYVPALKISTGEVLTEGPAIVQYLADQKPESGLAPAPGTHRALSPCRKCWATSTPRSTRRTARSSTTRRRPQTVEERKAYLAKRYALIEDQLAGKHYLFGDHFTRRRRVPLHRHQLGALREARPLGVPRTSSRSRSAWPRAPRCRRP